MLRILFSFLNFKFWVTEQELDSREGSWVIMHLPTFIALFMSSLRMYERDICGLKRRTSLALQTLMSVNNNDICRNSFCGSYSVGVVCVNVCVISLKGFLNILSTENCKTLTNAHIVSVQSTALTMPMMSHTESTLWSYKLYLLASFLGIKNVYCDVTIVTKTPLNVYF